MKKTDAAPSTVISALTARHRFGQILEEVDQGRRSYLVEKRGSPKAIILGIQDYVRLAAPEPAILRAIGEASARRGTGKLTTSQIDRVIQSARNARRRASS